MAAHAYPSYQTGPRHAPGPNFIPPPFPGAPPNVPPGVNAQQWQNGFWQYNPHYKPSRNPNTQHVPWVPSHHWMPKSSSASQQSRPQQSQASQQAAAASTSSFNPYKRVIPPPSAEYLAMKLVDNPLGLSDLTPVPNEEYYRQGKISTPWIWNPATLDPDNEDEESESTSGASSTTITPAQRSATEPPTGAPQASQQTRANSEPPEPEIFTAKRALEPTFSPKIVRTPDHYRQSQSPSPNRPARTGSFDSNHTRVNSLNGSTSPTPLARNPSMPHVLSSASASTSSSRMPLSASSSSSSMHTLNSTSSKGSFGSFSSVSSYSNNPSPIKSTFGSSSSLNLSTGPPNASPPPLSFLTDAHQLSDEPGSMLSPLVLNNVKLSPGPSGLSNSTVPSSSSSSSPSQPPSHQPSPHQPSPHQRQVIRPTHAASLDTIPEAPASSYPGMRVPETSAASAPAHASSYPGMQGQAQPPVSSSSASASASASASGSQMQQAQERAHRERRPLQRWSSEEIPETHRHERRSEVSRRESEGGRAHARASPTTGGFQVEGRSDASPAPRGSVETRGGFQVESRGTGSDPRAQVQAPFPPPQPMPRRPSVKDSERREHRESQRDPRLEQREQPQREPDPRDRRHSLEAARQQRDREKERERQERQARDTADLTSSVAHMGLGSRHTSYVDPHISNANAHASASASASSSSPHGSDPRAYAQPRRQSTHSRSQSHSQSSSPGSGSGSGAGSSRLTPPAHGRREIPTYTLRTPSPHTPPHSTDERQHSHNSADSTTPTPTSVHPAYAAKHAHEHRQGHASANPLPPPPMPSPFEPSPHANAALAQLLTPPPSATSPRPHPHPSPTPLGSFVASGPLPHPSPSPSYSARTHAPYPPRPHVRVGYWNRRGDHLTPDGYIVFAPQGRQYPPELRTYPTVEEGYQDDEGAFAAYCMRPELPSSLPRYGKPPEEPYDKFLVYTQPKD